MKKGVLMQPLLQYNKGRVSVAYETDPYGVAQGPIRAMQRYIVIVMSTLGTDALRPWFGTNLNALPSMNISSVAEIQLYVKDEIKSATAQFFRLQEEEASSTYPIDVIQSIELLNVEVSDTNNVRLDVMFYPLQSDSIKLSIEV